MISRSDLFDRIMEISFEEIFIFDAGTLKFLNCSKGTLANLGYTLDEMKQLTPYNIKPKFDKSDFIDFIRPLRDGETDLETFETIHQRKDGSVYDVRIRLQHVPMDDSVFIAMVTDITDQNHYENKLKALAYTDPGTNLFNRRYFMKHLSDSIHCVNSAKNSAFALIALDMDDLKQVNDKYGHLVGDVAINTTAERLKGIFARKVDIVARSGGDEFIVLCTSSDFKDVVKRCNILLKSFENDITVDTITFKQTVSIGLYWVDGSTHVTEKLVLSEVDNAMYKAKNTGKNILKISNGL